MRAPGRVPAQRRAPRAGGRGRASAFDEPEELGDALAQLAAELDERRARIRVPALADVADRYLEVLRG